MCNFMKIRLAILELLRASGQTERPTDGQPCFNKSSARTGTLLESNQIKQTEIKIRK
jgi:hypothetical protein